MKMHLSRKVAALGGALTLSAILAPQAGAAFAPDGMQLDSCAVTMQPYLGDYHLSFEYADGRVERMHTATQEGGIDGEHNRWVVAPQTFNVAVGELDAVLWTSSGYRLPVDDDSCAWADGFVYDAAFVGGKRMVDSVVIAPLYVPVPSTTSTTEQPPAPTTTAPFTEQTTVQTPPPVEVSVPTPLPPVVENTTTSVPSETPTSLPTVSAPQLPVTGADTGKIAAFGGGMVLAGGALAWVTRRRD